MLAAAACPVRKLARHATAGGGDASPVAGDRGKKAAPSEHAEPSSSAGPSSSVGPESTEPGSSGIRIENQDLEESYHWPSCHPVFFHRASWAGPWIGKASVHAGSFWDAAAHAAAAIAPKHPAGSCSGVRRRGWKVLRLPRKIGHRAPRQSGSPALPLLHHLPVLLFAPTASRFAGPVFALAAWLANHPSQHRTLVPNSCPGFDVSSPPGHRASWPVPTLTVPRLVGRRLAFPPNRIRHRVPWPTHGRPGLFSPGDWKLLSSVCLPSAGSFSACPVSFHPVSDLPG